MSLVEGIGDEIIQFLGILLVVVFGVIAWCSTRITELPTRTILIMGRRSPNEFVNVTNQQTSSSESIATGQSDRNVSSNLLSNESSTGDSSDKNNVSAQPSDFRNNPEMQGTSENVSNHQKDNSKVTSSTETSHEQSETQQNSTDNIRIRLRYLNDDQKLVDGRLQEPLGDFKKRHFSDEISRQKRIRLIFNGRIMQSDVQTLQGYGLYDNCVVHCLIHAQQNNNRASSQANGNTTPPEWNLGILLYACISIALGFAWFFRYHYSYLFTLTTTAALISLTGMVAVSVIGLYISDEEVIPS